MLVSSVEVAADGSNLTLTCDSGESATFHGVWLRDNAFEQRSGGAEVEDGSGQKLITLLDQPAAPRIESAELAAGTEGELLAVAIDGQTFRFPLSWLREHRYSHTQQPQRAPGWLSEHVCPWLGGGLDLSALTVDFKTLISDDRCLYDWLEGFHRYGLALVTGFPTTEPDAIAQVVARFGYIRSTNYGEVFEVRSEIKPDNLANTGLGLEVHTDNPYRDPVPTIQLLACMANSADGGDSIVVDGFAAAKAVQETDPEAFKLLSHYPVDFRYAAGDDVDLRSCKPLIELGSDGELLAVRFNNRSAAPITRVPSHHMVAYYSAMRTFAQQLNAPSQQVTFKLAAGELFMVDNRRVLHGRAAVVGAGERWLRGCYADVDSLSSKLRVLRRRFDS